MAMLIYCDVIRQMTFTNPINFCFEVPSFADYKSKSEPFFQVPPFHRETPLYQSTQINCS